MNLGRPPGRNLDDPLGRELGGKPSSGPVCIPPDQQTNAMVLPWCMAITPAVGTIIAPDDAVGLSRGNDVVDPFGTGSDASFFDDFDEFTIANINILKHCRIVTVTPLPPEVTGLSLEILDPCSNILDNTTSFSRDVVDENVFEAIGGKPVNGLADGVPVYFRLTAIEG